MFLLQEESKQRHSSHLQSHKQQQQQQQCSRSEDTVSLLQCLMRTESCTETWRHLCGLQEEKRTEGPHATPENESGDLLMLLQRSTSQQEHKNTSRGFMLYYKHRLSFNYKIQFLLLDCVEQRWYKQRSFILLIWLI